MTDVDQRSPKVCAVCGVVLDRVGPAPLAAENDDWVHAPEMFGFLDHVAVPVDYDAVPVNALCDFCHEEIPYGKVWTIPSETFPLPEVDGSNIGAQSMGNWAACEVCATLIRRRRWTQLVTRATDLFVASDFYRGNISRPALRRHMREIYGRLELNMTGPPRRWRAGDEKHG